VARVDGVKRQSLLGFVARIDGIKRRSLCFASGVHGVPRCKPWCMWEWRRVLMPGDPCRKPQRACASGRTAHAGCGPPPQEFAAAVRGLGGDLARWPEDARNRALAMLVHACDIGNPAKPLALSLQWSERIVAENLAQVPGGALTLVPFPRGCARLCCGREPRAGERALFSLLFSSMFVWGEPTFPSGSKSHLSGWSVMGSSRPATRKLCSPLSTEL
jgi:hypothetical protein